jgi:hypothetical protein
MAMKRLTVLLRSDWAFYIPLGLFILAAMWVAFSSIYPMAFDEEFHYGLIKIYATGWLPYGIVHTSDMAQFGAATADPSYLFHYLMSFPYRVFHAFGLSDTAIIILLRLMDLGFIIAGLLIFRRAILNAGISKPVVNVGLWLMTLIPVFVMLAAQINYDNLLFPIVAWSIYLIVDMTNTVKKSGDIPLRSAWLLVIAVLIGISIKYAFLPIALVLFIWSIGLFIVSIRRHNNSFGSYIQNQKKQLSKLSVRALSGLIGLTLLSIFFASHYVVNHTTYGHAIPTCEQVFTEDECSAYGPWNRNRYYAATRSSSFTPLSYPAYMATEWLPGMAQRLTFSLAGKTNDFQTKLPLPAVIFSFVLLTIVGVISFAIQAVRRNISWFGWLTVLLTGTYVGVLSLQLYDDYVDTAQPVAINGRYLILLLPLVGVVLIQAINATFKNVPAQHKTIICLGIIAVLFFGGAGLSTYILQSEPHWFWPGFGQTSHAIFKSALQAVTLPFRFS